MLPPLAVELLGGIAAVLTTLCWVPQAARVIRERETSGLSLTTFAMMVGGIVLWLVYGLVIESWPLVVANTVSLGLNGTILAMKLRYG